MSEVWEKEPCPSEVFDILEIVEAIERCKSACRLMSLNVQNLVEHASDISADPVLMMVDILAFSEAWDGAQSHTVLNGFTCITTAKRNNVRVAGVAIYQNNSATTMAVPHTIRKLCTSYNVELGLSDDYGDICAAEITTMNCRTLLVCLYISPDTTKKQKKFFMARNLFKYHKETMPIIVTGNFNIDMSKEKNMEFADFMEKYLNLKLASDPTKATNLSGSCVDLTFTRNICLESKIYRSGFFFHRPVLSVLKC